MAVLQSITIAQVSLLPCCDSLLLLTGTKQPPFFLGKPQASWSSQHIVTTHVVEPPGPSTPQEISFPSFPNSSAMKELALTSSVAPYVIFLDPVLAAQSFRFEYSSIEPPPTMKTIASENPCLLWPKLALVPGPGTPGSPPGATEPPAWPVRIVDGCGIVPRAFALLGSKYNHASVFSSAKKQEQTVSGSFATQKDTVRTYHGHFRWTDPLQLRPASSRSDLCPRARSS